jgi:hypothetical protein
MRHILLLLLAILVAGAAPDGGVSNGQRVSTAESAAAEHAQIEEVKRVENDRLAAGVRKDIEAVSAATAEDYIQMISTARSWTRRLPSSASTRVTRNYGRILLTTWLCGYTATPPLSPGVLLRRAPSMGETSAGRSATAAYT